MSDASGTTKRFHDRQRLVESLEPLIAAGSVTRTRGEHGATLLNYNPEAGAQAGA